MCTNFVGIQNMKSSAVTLEKALELLSGEDARNVGGPHKRYSRVKDVEAL
ncbi:hypothetical protein MtrunA17_Chr1g0147771 [Medicago truncatula]|uniref:Uncharacterized protein n=1 Tax=Medicago truncatula TaxID=3880 RepID=A0A396JI15_MEDTR|nr:hypothetical protein MtrunA17_Chr1g0147771 [Medicago truncatula]